MGPWRTYLTWMLIVAMMALSTGCGGVHAGGAQSATALAVQTPDGQPATVDLKDGPVLFIAHWCPHCEHFLRSTSLDALPTVVSIWPRQGETLEDVAQATKAKLERTGWEGTPFYVLMGDAPDFVQGTPTLAWWDGERVRAENPLAMDPNELAAVVASR